VVERRLLGLLFFFGGARQTAPPEKKVVQGIWETRHPVPNPKTGQRSKRDKETTAQTIEVNGEPYGTNPTGR
jgi:hypothetical protein